jgi:hypothetical protein
MSRQERYATIGWWAALIVCALIAYWVSEGTSYHQLAIGILASSTTLAGAMLLFEAAWRVACLTLDLAGGKPANTSDKGKS